MNVTNPFKNWMFYVAYLAAIAIFGIISYIFWILDRNGSGLLLMVLLLSLPYVIVGFFTWMIVRRKNKAIALGMLLGSITPFIVIFTIGTGGCIVNLL